MPWDRIFLGGNISASGLSAERQRMEVIAQNIASANARMPDGTPYRRQEILFEALLADTPGPDGMNGVRVVGTEEDTETPFPRVFDPGHPNADDQGMVTMPNVRLPIEMVNLITANRAYEANLKALQSYRQMLEQTLNLLR